MDQYILGDLVYLWTDWVYAYYRKFPICDEDTYQRPMPVAIHTVHSEFVPCRDAVLMRAIKLWVSWSKFASDEERGQNRLGVDAIRPPGLLLISTDQFHDVAAHLWEASIRRPPCRYVRARPLYCALSVEWVEP